jgi:hypothetical protein
MKGLCHHDKVCIKYGLHHTGQESKEPYAVPKRIYTNISILISGGPFLHRFRSKIDGRDFEPNILINVGDYVIYGPDVVHMWKALKEAAVITVQFEPNTD